MAFAGIVALAGASEVTGALVLGAMANVGTIMSVVGAVTGNKDLLKLGGVIGLVGGVGGLVGGLGDAAASATGAAGLGGTDAAANSVADVAAGTSDAMQPGTFTDGLDSAPAAASFDAQQASNGVASTGTVGPPPVPAASSAAPATSNAGVTNASPPVQATGPQALGAPETRGPAAVDAPTGATTPSDPGGNSSSKGSSFFSNAWNFVTDPKNKEWVKGGLDILGGIPKGMQQADQFQQQMDLRNQQFAYQQALNANVTNGQNGSISGIIQPNGQPGLINGAVQPNGQFGLNNTARGY